MNTITFQERLFSITTIILTNLVLDDKTYSGSASGFYYNELEDKKESDWVKVEKQWPITNKHVVYNKIEGKDYLVDELTFCLRKNNGTGIDWFPIKLTKSELITRLRQHDNPIVDIVAIDVSDLLINIFKDNFGKGIMMPTALSNRNMPGKQPIVIDVSSDIIVASYPNGFYDTTNKYPIVKSGIIASAWGLLFNGLPMFEIDAQLFPGSSGGLVLSKPTNISFHEGSLNYSVAKQFVFLGVYSGEYKWKEIVELENGKKKEFLRSYGLGNVWYSYLVTEIVKLDRISADTVEIQ